MADSFFDRVATDCSLSARAIMEMADKFREYGDTASAGLADDISQRLGKLAYDAMSQTQTVTLPVRPKDPDDQA